MDLIDRYVNAVSLRLPRDRRGDVREELRSALQDALDRPDGAAPSEAEVVALLKQFGHPEQVAASYFPAGQYLIGPELFPLFQRVTRLALLGNLVVLTGIFAVGLLERPGLLPISAKIAELVGQLVPTACTTLAVILLIFAGVQRMGVAPPRSKGEWNPLDLPAVSEDDRVDRAEAIAGIVAPAVVLNLLNAVAQHLGAPGSPGLKLVLVRVLMENLSGLIAAPALVIVLNVTLLIQGCWRWYTRIATLAIDIFGLYVLYCVALDIAAARPAMLAAGLTPNAVNWLVQSAYWTVAVVAVIVAIHSLAPLYRCLKRSLPSDPAPREAADA